MEERELVILLLSLVVVGLALRGARHAEPVPGAPLLLGSALAWLAGYGLTVAEVVIPVSVDLAEHAAYLASCALLVGWVWRHWGEARP